MKTNANIYYNLLFILQVNNATARNSKKTDYVYCQAKPASTNSFPSSISSSSVVPSPAQINLNFSPDVYEDIFYPFFPKQLPYEAISGVLSEQSDQKNKQFSAPSFFTQFSSVNA